MFGRGLAYALVECHGDCNEVAGENVEEMEEEKNVERHKRQGTVKE